MQLIRSIQSFGATQEELIHLCKIFCRSVLEQSCVVWGPSLTQENSNNLERTQKTFVKLILKEKFQNYEQSLMLLNELIHLDPSHGSTWIHHMDQPGTIMWIQQDPSCGSTRIHHVNPPDSIMWIHQGPPGSITCIHQDPPL